MEERFLIPDMRSMQDLAEKLAKKAKPGQVFLLRGELGSGKTTFAQFFLKFLGVEGTISSPTFSIVEEYVALKPFSHCYHFDLYRLRFPQELEAMGFFDYFHPESLCLVEWPDNFMSCFSGAITLCDFKRDSSGGGRWVTLS